MSVAYAGGDNGKDYTRDRITWSGSSEGDGWFAVQKRAIGGKWQVAGWRKAERNAPRRSFVEQC